MFALHAKPVKAADGRYYWTENGIKWGLHDPKNNATNGHPFLTVSCLDYMFWRIVGIVTLYCSAIKHLGVRAMNKFN